MLKGKQTDVGITPFNFPCILLIVSRKTVHTRNKLVLRIPYILIEKPFLSNGSIRL